MSVALYITDLVQPKKRMIFNTYLDHDEPYLPPTTMFTRGKMCYRPSIKEKNKNDQQFRDFLYKCLIRHLTGDWGDICPVDKGCNDFLINKCGGIMSQADGEIVSYYNHPLDEELSVYVETGKITPRHTVLQTKVSFASDF